MVTREAMLSPMIITSLATVPPKISAAGIALLCLDPGVRRTVHKVDNFESRVNRTPQEPIESKGRAEFSVALIEVGRVQRPRATMSNRVQSGRLSAVFDFPRPDSGRDSLCTD